jgi:hypothetical protein
MRTATVLALLLALGVAATASASPVARWLDSLPDGVRPDAEARKELEAKVEKAEDPLEAAIRLLRPEYGAAMDILELEGEEKAIPLLEAIEKSPPDALTGAYARYRRAESLLLIEEVEAAASLLQKVAVDRALEGTPAEPAVLFLSAFTWARLGMKLEAYQGFHVFLERYPDAPERYRALALQIVRELESEYLSPLLDVAGKMQDAARLLERARADDPTQEKQKQVVELLEKLIELAEQMEKSGSGSGGGKSSGGGSASGTNSSSPAQDSFLPTGSTTTGNLRRVSRGDPDEAWGDLRDKEREEALQFLKERFPGRYHEMLKEYYRALSEGK